MKTELATSPQCEDFQREGVRVIRAFYGDSESDLPEGSVGTIDHLSSCGVSLCRRAVDIVDNRERARYQRGERVAALQAQSRWVNDIVFQNN